MIDMSVSIGIVGLPNVGKSTLFNALTDAEALAANYPFATIEPNTGIVPVPDERLAVLQKMYSAEKVIPATVTFVDIAGLVAGASKGEGLGNKFLANIRQCNAICHIVRAFENDASCATTLHPPRQNKISKLLIPSLFSPTFKRLKAALPRAAKRSQSQARCPRTTGIFRKLAAPSRSRHAPVRPARP